MACSWIGRLHSVKREILEEWWKRWIQVWYTWYIVRTFANATMYPHPAQQNKKMTILPKLFFRFNAISIRI
jgi:hypothetical protein